MRHSADERFEQGYTMSQLEQNSEGEPTAGYVMDRIVDGVWAVLVPDTQAEAADPSPVTVPRRWMPAGSREGDVLRVSIQTDTDAGAPQTSVRFTLDSAATAQRLERMATLRAKIPRGPSGDLDL